MLIDDLKKKDNAKFINKQHKRANNSLNKSEMAVTGQSESSSSDTDDDSIVIHKPNEVRFNSLHIILPSEKQSCLLYDIDQKVDLSDFVLMKSLAKGGYGKVLLCRKKNTNDVFAIKVLDIAQIKKKNCVDTVINEKKILRDLNTNFIVRGVYTFKS